MSWDFDLVADVCKHCGRGGESVYERNYTYNVSPMFYEAMGEGGIRQLDGLTGAECLEILDSGIEAMAADPDKYRALNPPNGWGDYDSALQMLREMRAACVEYPEAGMRIS